jgi:hypothetical protein
MRNYNDRPSNPFDPGHFLPGWTHRAEALLLSGGPFFPPGILLRLDGTFLRRGMAHRSLNQTSAA